ncbi:hypothetical protein D3C83_170490 [compost metagenome]
MLSFSCVKRLARNAGKSAIRSSRACRSMSLEMSSTRILQPSSSPKKLTLGPTTGPRSSNCGCECVARLARNRGSAFVG